uniref:4Fe-4S ferredoxin-type domain-containing protein n=1 Tax=Kalanchoe fedtschenkoi TaxID=63787 RepID=A0A7N0ZUV6_KALFE
MNLSCTGLSVVSSRSRCLENVGAFVANKVAIPTSPLQSLRLGTWVKLICGASFEDVLHIRNLSLVYTLAGVDCIDCAADASVVTAVNQGIVAAQNISAVRRPWVMISVNDSEDLHFRKAEFNPEECPIYCPRPCEKVCPADAISGGVLTERCYGCGRCFPVCPYDKIREITYVRDVFATAELLRRNDVDAIEIHTDGRDHKSFAELWNGLGSSIEYLKLVAVSFPNLGDLTLPSMRAMYAVMQPHLSCHNLWQLDGRPMSGDIGRGATREAIAFAVSLAAAEDRPNGFLQLAGGTNANTVHGLKNVGLFQMTATAKNTTESTTAGAILSDSSSYAVISGVAYGGYARKIVGRVLRSMESEYGLSCIEDHPNYLLEALKEAHALVGTVKCQ